MSQLVIAEKPSVAMSLADVLGAKIKRNGYYEGNGYFVSWCVGHLIELAQPEAYEPRYAKWRREDLPILPKPWKFVVSEGTKKQYEVLKYLMHDGRVHAVVCATDAGREGELIFRLVYKQTGCTKPVKRLWISSLEESAIREGFENLKDGSEYENLYKAAMCRVSADWLVGMNATRHHSLMYGQTLNIGRVMTPTLALVTARDAAIAAFEPEAFYTVQMSCGFLASSARIKEKAEAERIAQACSHKTATVVKVERKAKTEKPPKLYDLTTLQRDANRIFGFTAQQTLDYAQSLYEKKLTTYPRTDSRYLTSDMSGIIAPLARVTASKLPFTAGLDLPVKAMQVVDDQKVSDHHAIIPTNSMAGRDISSLPQGEKDLLNLIIVRLLCSVGDVYRYEETQVTLECEGHTFTAKGKTVLQMGWQIPEATFRGSLGARGKANKESEAPIPQLTQGQTLGPVMTSVKEGKTTPPKCYTEDTLLAAMENAGADEAPEDAERKGLGTPATRAETIEKLIKAGFLERKGDRKARFLTATDKGNALIAVVPQQLQSPTMTAQWEHRLKEIERGGEDGRQFMADIKTFVCDLVENTERVKDAEALFPSRYERLGVCPRCGAPVVEMKHGFFCENRCCQFGIWKNNKFFVMRGHPVTAEVVSMLIQDGHVFLKNLRSAKSGKTYNATVYLNDPGEGAPQFRLEFEKKGKA